MNRITIGETDWRIQVYDAVRLGQHPTIRLDDAVDHDFCTYQRTQWISINPEMHNVAGGGPRPFLRVEFEVVMTESAAQRFVNWANEESHDGLHFDSRCDEWFGHGPAEVDPDQDMPQIRPTLTPSFFADLDVPFETDLEAYEAWETWNRLAMDTTADA